MDEVQLVNTNRAIFTGGTFVARIWVAITSTTIAAASTIAQNLSTNQQRLQLSNQGYAIQAAFLATKPQLSRC
jgi:hypothetical protein